MDETWKAIAVAVMALPQHAKLHVPRDRVAHPTVVGLYRSMGLARRCRHYRKALPDGRGLHVHEYDDHYRVHWDAVDPSISFLRHVWHDVKHAVRMRGKHAAPVPYGSCRQALASDLGFRGRHRIPHKHGIRSLTSTNVT